jgi:hypothetical protein
MMLWIVLMAVAVTTQAETVRVSVSSNGTEANGDSFSPALAADGRYVAFNSESNNLVAGDNNGVLDTFVHDRETGGIMRVSVASDGTEANRSSGRSSPAISRNGRYVVFNSSANNLVAGDNNDRSDIFVHDRQSGETTRVSVASDDTEANSSSLYTDISADSRYVAFESNATNLVAGDNNGVRDIFVHDRETGETIRVNVASDGTEANAGTEGYWGWLYSNPISENGRYVAFTSLASNLVVGDNNDYEDIFVHDLETRETTQISVASDGTAGNQFSFLDDMSEDGRYVVFESGANNLVAGDNNGTVDVFVHDRQNGETKRVSIASDGTEGNNVSTVAAISGDGRYVVFQSWADNLVPLDTNDHHDIFVHDRHTGQTAQASITYSGGEANGSSYWTTISEDGDYVAFDSGADNLVPGDNNSEWDIFVADNPHLFQINAGLNDAWFNPDTAGQGFFIIVFPETRMMFVSWNTFDTERPDASVMSHLGDPGQRWLTANGPYLDNQAVLDVAITSGGVFDSPEPATMNEPGGTLTVNFTSCTAGTIAYDIPSIDRQGVVPIRRIALENVALCEALNDM